MKRQKFNRLIRKTYRKRRIADVARIESTPSGRRVTGTFNGEPHYSMYSATQMTADPEFCRSESRFAAAGLTRAISAK